MKRTGSMYSRVPPAVIIIRIRYLLSAPLGAGWKRITCFDSDFTFPGFRGYFFDRFQDLLRLRHSADALGAACEPAFFGTCELETSFFQRLDIVLHGGICPHIIVHRRGTKHRSGFDQRPAGAKGGAEHIAPDAVC